MGKKQYILNIIFFAGSNAPEDTDRALVMVSSEAKLTLPKLRQIFESACMVLDADADEAELDAAIEFFREKHGLDIRKAIESGKFTFAEGCNVDMLLDFLKEIGFDIAYKINGYIENAFNLEVWEDGRVY